ncbi:MAG: T9SS type A sorting domain-containing protein [Crocinitomicaceae bacterium]|nr:T9SS type A sorting domain-containing protein [Crocinitomicaceae bacterium]
MNRIILSTLISFCTYTSYSQWCLTGGPSSTADSNIESVSLIGASGSISYTGCPGISGVEENLAQTVYLDAGSLYTVDIQFGTCGGNYAGVGEAWIDFNLDGMFDISESIGTWSGTPPTTLSSFNFFVPGGAITGQTRMRIAQAEGSTLPLDPCGTYTWGSMTDFSIYIQNGVDCTSYIGDDLSDPRIVSALPFAEDHDNSICYSNQNLVYNSPDVYYLVLVDVNTVALNISLCGSSFDTFLSVFDTDGNVLGVNDDSPDCGIQSKLSVNTQGHDSVYVIVDGWSFSSGPYSIEMNSETLGLNQSQSNKFSIYPNPTKDLIKIQNYSGIVVLRDAHGKEVLKQSINLNQSISTNHLKAGFYFIELRINDSTSIQKLIIE